MKQRSSVGAILVATVLLGRPSAGAASEIERLIVEPNPVVYSGPLAPAVSISVDVKRASIFDNAECIVTIDPGDGSSFERLVDRRGFGSDPNRPAPRIFHNYAKPGTYTVVALGMSGCRGKLTARVTVQQSASGPTRPPSDDGPPKPRPPDVPPPPAQNPCRSSSTKGGSVDLAAAWNDAGSVSLAVFPGDGNKFLPHSQWNVRDGGWGDTVKWVAADFTGDGLTDIAAIWNNGGANTLTVRQSTGSKFIYSHWATNAGGWMNSSVWLAGDFNGDGCIDLASAWNDRGAASIAVFLGDGTRFLPYTQWNVRDGGWGDAVKWVAADFNGDGRTDIGAIWNNGGTNTLTVRLSTGSTFVASHWATNAGGWMDSTVWLAGDFNGDGRIDLAGAWNDAGALSIAVFLGDGKTFQPPTQWSVRNGGWGNTVKWVAADFNGDGRTDLGAIWNNGGNNTLTVRLSNGSQFTHGHWATNAGGWMDSSVWFAGRFRN